MTQMNHLAENPIHVVIALDQERDALHEHLRAQTDIWVETVSSWNDLKKLLDSSLVDIVLLGSQLGEHSSIAVNKAIKANYHNPPGTVLVDGDATLSSAIKAFRSGFNDVLPGARANLRDLRDSLDHVFELVSQEREYNTRIAYLEKSAQRDTVTGLPNIHFLQERVQQLIETDQHRKLQFAVVLIRFNEIDDINASFGLKVGDQIMQAFAERLKSASRLSDSYGRYDRNTFLYLIDRDVSEDSIKAASRRLSEAMHFYLNLDDLGLELSASIGGALHPADGANLEELLAKAEHTLEDDARHLQTNATQAWAVPPNGTETPAPAEQRLPELATAGGPDAGPAQADIAVMQAAPAQAAGTADSQDADPARRDSNRRQAQRRRTLKGGKLIMNNGFSTMNCVIRDLSDTGARVVIDGHFQVPKFLELMFMETKERVPTESRWQRGQEIGLMFLE